MVTKEEALELALKALERSVYTCFDQYAHEQVMSKREHFVNQTITTIKEALAQPAQEPLAIEAEKFIAKEERKREQKYAYVPKLHPSEWMDEPAQEPVNNKPLPCPFCGHTGLNFLDGSTHRWGIASCETCGASCGEVRREYPDDGAWHKKAIFEWNQRTTPPAAQPAQEPCTHRIADARNQYVKSGYFCLDCGMLFSAADHFDPPQRPWVGLTEEEIKSAVIAYWGEMKGGPLVMNREYVRAIETKLKEKNT